MISGERSATLSVRREMPARRAASACVMRCARRSIRAVVAAGRGLGSLTDPSSTPRAALQASGGYTMRSARVRSACNRSTMTDPKSAAPATETEDGPVSLTLLDLLVTWAEDTGTSSSVTLSVGGLLVSGQLASRKNYTRGIADAFA